jgi:hypothetical protein
VLIGADAICSAVDEAGMESGVDRVTGCCTILESDAAGPWNTSGAWFGVVQVHFLPHFLLCFLLPILLESLQLHEWLE